MSLPEGWVESTLGEVAIVINGGTPSTKNSNYWGYGISWITPKDLSLNKNMYISRGEKSITKLGLEKSSARLLPKNTILFSSRAPIGYVAIAEIELTTNQGFKNIVCNEIDTHYLFIYYWLKNITSYIEKQSSGSTFSEASTALMKSLIIILPPLQEQKSIANILSSFDEKIELLKAQNETLEQMAQGVFREWFVDGGDEGWEVKKLGDYIKTNISTIKKDTTLSVIQYLDTASLTKGMISCYQALNLEDAPSRAKRKVKHLDILFSTVRPDQNHYGILRKPDENVIVSTGYCVVTCHNINPYFVYLFLTTEKMTEYLHNIAEGSTSTYPSIKPIDIESLEFLLPAKEKLDVFFELADSWWEKIDYNHQQIQTLQKTRDTLLPQLMSGRVRLLTHR